MSFVANAAAGLKSFDRKTWPDHRVCVSEEAAALLLKHKIVMADVGAADGPPEMWLSVRQYLHFITFEPNPRPGQTESTPDTTNFPIGLWSYAGKMKLYITAHPDSASLLPVNTEFFADFRVKEGMEMTGSAEIEVDTLDHVLEGRPGLLPNFIKIDVEGGDLEVLKGAEQALAETILGIRIETSFAELHTGRPLLWEIDQFLRDHGYALFHLGRNHWIRNCGMHGFTSEPQLIWSDAVYFLSRKPFLKRLARMSGDERMAGLAKYVVILLRHGVHDYAVELIDAAVAERLVPVAFGDSLRNSVRNSMDTSAWYFIKGFLGVCFSLGILAITCTVASARQRGIYYVKQRVGRFAYDVWRLTSREGRVANSHVGDPFI